ncbi:MAG: hypothetical protein KatS3mg090_0582 [Patescibacteria group bacterium]|nr:MAG: hypothetical protein KatS3mg090_0582 [Patescibacteria group bacterium]
MSKLRVFLTISFFVFGVLAVLSAYLILSDKGKSLDNSSSAQSNSLSKYNLIFIIADDMPYNLLNVYNNISDNPWIDNSIEQQRYRVSIQTPNLARLAREGVYFNKMYVSMPECVPSRAGLLTGKYAHMSGVESNTSGFNVVRNRDNLVQILKNNGYFNYFIGKCHLGSDYYEGASNTRIDVDKQNPEDIYRFLKSVGFDDTVSLVPDQGYVPDWYNFQISRNGGPVQSINPSTMGSDGRAYITNFLTNEAISKIRTARQPFMMWLAHVTPHALHFGTEDEAEDKPNNLPPYIRSLTRSQGPSGYRYPINSLYQPPSFNAGLSDKPNILRDSYPSLVYQIEKNNIKRRYQVAHEMVNNLDTRIGDLFNALQSSGKLDNTIIVFYSDNGILFGEHNLYLKGPSFYEELVRTPLIIWFPPSLRSRFKQGTISALTANIDLAPTLLDILNLPVPKSMQGVSQKPVLQGRFTKVRESVLLQFEDWVHGKYPMRGIITDDGYKFTHYLATSIPKLCAKGLNYYETCTQGGSYSGKDMEFYNLNEDPFELNNILYDSNTNTVVIDNKYNQMVRSNSNYREALLKVGREMAYQQTVSNDPYRRNITNLSYRKIGTTSGLLSFNTDSFSIVEVQYQQNNCQDCKTQRVVVDTLKKVHNIRLDNLERGKRYDIKIFAINLNVNGAYKEMSIVVR